jgi:DNA anti-recombination protein RmuC
MSKQLQILNIVLETGLRRTQVQTLRALARFVDNPQRLQEIEQEAVKIESDIQRLEDEMRKLQRS